MQQVVYLLKSRYFLFFRHNYLSFVPYFLLWLDYRVTFDCLHNSISIFTLVIRGIVFEKKVHNTFSMYKNYLRLRKKTQSSDAVEKF